jgi:hypothetical protein
MKTIAIVSSILTLALPIEAWSTEAEKPRPIEAARPPRFGDAHGLVLGGDFALQFARTEWGGGATSSQMFVRPAVDYFVLDHLSVGGGVSIERQQADQSRVTWLGVAPRIGYEVPLGESCSLWPIAGIAYDRAVEVDWVNSYGGRWMVSGHVRAPLLAHLTDHFFVGLGPRLDVVLAQEVPSTRLMTYGIESTIGGWL